MLKNFLHFSNCRMFFTFHSFTVCPEIFFFSFGHFLMFLGLRFLQILEFFTIVKKTPCAGHLAPQAPPLVESGPARPMRTGNSWRGRDGPGRAAGFGLSCHSALVTHSFQSDSFFAIKHFKILCVFRDHMKRQIHFSCVLRAPLYFWQGLLFFFAFMIFQKNAFGETEEHFLFV